jgi:hypothetical protein
MALWTDGFLRRGIRNQESEIRTPTGDFLISGF